jgi:hypothetical protein
LVIIKEKNVKNPLLPLVKMMFLLFDTLEVLNFLT